MHRRDFLRTASALALTPILPAQTASGIRFSVMLWALNKISPTEKSIELVADAGYQGIELVGEQYKWSPQDAARITQRVKQRGLGIDSMAGVSTGFADPALREKFLSEFKICLESARRIDCPQIILCSRKGAADAPRQATRDACIETLKMATDLAAAANKQIVIEPIDNLEDKTSYLTSVTEAAEISRAIANPHLRVLYDLYHEQRQHGNLIEQLEKAFDQIALFHIADVPGRHEPGTGEVRFENAYRKIAQLKYTGFIAMEFYPTTDPLTSLRKAREDAQSALQQGARA